MTEAPIDIIHNVCGFKKGEVEEGVSPDSDAEGDEFHDAVNMPGSRYDSNDSNALTIC